MYYLQASFFLSFYSAISLNKRERRRRTENLSGQRNKFQTCFRTIFKTQVKEMKRNTHSQPPAMVVVMGNKNNWNSPEMEKKKEKNVKIYFAIWGKKKNRNALLRSVSKRYFIGLLYSLLTAVAFAFNAVWLQ